MNKLFITLVVAMLVQACAIHADLQPASAAVDLVTDISDLEDIAKIVPKQAERVLYVFDIDDTLLTSHQEFGSDYWFAWQFDRNNRSPVPCVLDVAVILTEEKSLLPTQHNAPAIFNGITQDKLLLTARSASTSRGATLRELQRNGYVLPASLGRSDRGYLFALKDRKLPASYFDGIYMVTGQDKGKALIHLLNDVLEVPGKYKTVVLVDDGQGNIDKMRAAVKDKGMDYYGLHYIRINKPAVVAESTRKDWKKSWRRFIAGLGAVSRARADRILASQCAYQ